ncbi:MAG TPA: hypothetical protein VF631_01300 [Allosphingosinicella sp.]|jgi:hypothetical protein|uniref:hypothetical protein n=1 Tax=Allosphingosinicella sp. TaxID=2823234 RepID=UPI002F26ED4F
MALAVQPYPGALLGLAESLEGALYTFEDTRETAFRLVDRQLAVHGPFPVFTSRPDDIEDDRNAIGDVPAERSGWRALVTTNEKPLALIEIVFDAAGAELYSIRGPEAATAFARVLSAAAIHLDSPGSYEVRWLVVPDVYVSALWLAAPDSIFLPARLGSPFRPEAGEIGWPQLREAILPLIEAARPGPEFVDRDDGSPRSGLPRRR